MLSTPLAPPLSTLHPLAVWIGIGLALLAPPAAASTQTPDCGWKPTFGEQPGTDSWVYDLEVFDDGSGRALYATGRFNFAGSLMHRIAKWNGSNWVELDMNGPSAHDLEVFDDGNDPALYACGTFTEAGGVPARGIAKWDGSTWSDLEGGLKYDAWVMEVFDDGSGPALFVGGDFTNAGGQPTNLIAKWDGTTWSELGGGLVGYDVFALTSFNDGTGPALFVGGEIFTADGTAVNHVAKWDGSNWTNLGSGILGTNSRVQALTVFDDGNGPALYAGGYFTAASGAQADYLAKWDGTNWVALPSEVDGFVNALTVFDSANGSLLFAGGGFSKAGSVRSRGAAAWDGTSWSGLEDGVDGSVQTFAAFDDGDGSELYVGGSFSFAGAVVASNIARWNGSQWSAMVPDGGLNGPVYSLLSRETSSGPVLVAGGDFTAAGGVPANRVAEWNGFQWTPFGQGLNSTVLALAEFDAGNGKGPELYAGGHFYFTSDGGFARAIARWDGAAWRSLGSGLALLSSGASVWDMTVFDDGSGPALYVGGEFSSAGGLPADRIARWDGVKWRVFDHGPTAPVYALAPFDDGTGEKLYAGGHFTHAGTLIVNSMAQWSGNLWSPVGAGMNSAVHALTTFDDGSGTALFAGGAFTSAGSALADRVAKYDGQQWSALGSGLGGSNTVRCYALATLDEGGETALYAGGNFTTAGGQPANGVARWDGTTWSPLGAGVTAQGQVRALAQFRDGAGPALIVGGGFGSAPESGDSYLAKWGCSRTAAAATYCTAGTSANGCRATLSASGTASASADGDFALTATGVEGAKSGLFFFGANGRQAHAWGNGTSFQCVAPPVMRTGLLSAVGTPGQCDGWFGLDLNALWCPDCSEPGKNPGAGATAQAQLWYRDPLSTSNQSTSLSDAVEFAVAP